jgi:Mn-dependent DtxR family transcriptional regulator
MQTNYEVLGKVLASSYRLKTIELLSKGPMTTTQLARRLNVSLPHAIETIRQLERLGLVECKTPGLRKGKLYGLTDSGKRILQNLSIMIKHQGEGDVRIRS